MDGSSTESAGDQRREDFSKTANELFTEFSKRFKPFAPASAKQPDNDEGPIQLVRSLDQGQLLAWLQGTRLSPYHATEEHTLRWLLKHMALAPPESQFGRRSPASWKVLQTIVGGVPSVTLARYLADQKFLSILQETLKDVSSSIIHAPTDRRRNGKEAGDSVVGAEPSPPSSNPRKRKREMVDEESPDAVHPLAGDLEIGSAILEALQIVLKVANDDILSEDVLNRTGVERLKSLFHISAEKMLELLTPMLDIFLLAFATKSDGPPIHWLSTFISLWDMRLPGNADAFEAATHITKGACALLKRTSRLEDDQWGLLLRRFLTRSIILPARTEFIKGQSLDNGQSLDKRQSLHEGQGPSDGQDLGILRRAGAVTVHMTATSAPILFELAIALPNGTGPKKQYDGWVHAVFDLLEKHVAALDGPERNRVMKEMVDLAAKYSKSPSLDSLRSVCMGYAMSTAQNAAQNAQSVDLSLLSAIVACDADVFLVSETGSVLLDELLKATVEQYQEVDASLDVQAIAEGLLRAFARARDLPGFVERWFLVLNACHSVALHKGIPSIETAWSSEKLRSTFAHTLESSVTPRQLVSVLDWLGDHSKDHAESALCILHAIANGIRSQPFLDAARTRLRRLADILIEGKDRSISMLATNDFWAIVRESTRGAAMEELDDFYKDIHTRLENLNQHDELDLTTKESLFRCVCRLWACNYPDGTFEAEIGNIACQYLDKAIRWMEEAVVEDGGPSSITDHILRIVEWPLQEIPGFIRLLANRYANFQDFVKHLLTFCDWLHGGGLGSIDDDEGGGDETSEALKIQERVTRIASYFLQDLGVNNLKLARLLVDHAARGLLKEPLHKSWGLLDVCPISLLDLPGAIVGREKRELLMQSWYAATYSGGDENGPTMTGVSWRRTLVIMVALMRRPVFYEAMGFKDLVVISKSIKHLHMSGSEDDRSYLSDIMQLFRELCLLTFRQLPKNGQIASTYFNGSPGITDIVTEDVYHEYPNMVILAALSEAHGDGNESPTLGIMIKDCLEHFVRDRPYLGDEGTVTDRDWRLLPILTAAESSRYAVEHLRRETLSAAVVSQLVVVSNRLTSAGLELGWKLWKMLCQACLDADDFPLDLGFFSKSPDRDVGLFKECLDVQLQGKGEDEKLLYVRDIRDTVAGDGDQVGTLFAMRHIIEGLSPKAATPGFGIPECHTWLCERLSRAGSSEELALLTDMIHHLLDQKAKALKQWNIDQTLSGIMDACSTRPGHTTHAVLRSSPRGFERLCRLVELILKRHRLRLEGHFNLVVGCLQVLLRQTMLWPPLRPPPDSDENVVDEAVWERHVRALARIIQLTCEPTTASVTRYAKASGNGDSGGAAAAAPPPQMLNSAVARVRQLTGQQMHTVLMTYIATLLGGAAGAGAVPRREVGQAGLERRQTTAAAGPLSLPPPVRECLEEQALWPVWGVLSMDGMRRLDDALDQGGRTVMKELHRRWARFGKWTGV